MNAKVHYKFVLHHLELLRMKQRLVFNLTKDWQQEIEGEWHFFHGVKGKTFIFLCPKDAPGRKKEEEEKAGRPENGKNETSTS